MNISTETWWILTTGATLAIGIITYFLKRTMSKQDKHEEEINHIKLTYVTKDDLKDVKLDFAKTTQKLQNDVEEIKDNLLMKRDFIREHTSLEEKMEKRYDILEDKLDRMYETIVHMNDNNH